MLVHTPPSFFPVVEDSPGFIGATLRRILALVPLPVIVMSARAFVFALVPLPVVVLRRKGESRGGREGEEGECGTHGENAGGLARVKNRRVCMKRWYYKRRRRI